ncbi:MAG: translation initiation factor IF-2 [Candidatus Latescibacterota bacterium]|nr:translation initiation factor IF-2 [Candidatus Latescibacterota bacterium]
MEKRRVYQVAKEQKLSSDALISMLKELGIEVKSHMSVVTPEMLEAITVKIKEEKQSSKDEMKRQRDKEETRKQPVRPSSSPATKPKKKPVPSNGRSTNPSTKRPSMPTAGPAPPPDVGADPEKEERRRRNQRRGKRDSDPIANLKDELKDKRELSTKSPQAPSLEETGGRRRGGKKRKGNQAKETDAREVQENLRKTLSQLNEGRARRRYDRNDRDETDGEVEEVKEITVSEFITLGEFAEQLGVKPNEVIAVCLQLGVMTTINQRLDMDTMQTVADEFGYTVTAVVDEDGPEIDEISDEEEIDGERVPRCPVVTVMGHVDHGKTSLLDYLRKAQVAEGESGGITQHIGAYSVPLASGKKITFLDTPGHAAFTAMRARGSRVTDLVIVIIAADDSIMPQTIEAIDHARAAKVPMVIAINKSDLPTSDPDKIKRELAERDVLVEDWGGKVPCVPISALNGDGISDLLEILILESEILELTAVEECPAKGSIIEAQLDKGRGPVATVLVQQGVLRVGDPFISGVYNGRVRALLDEYGKQVKEAGPSIPVQVLGLPGVPQAGDTFSVTKSEREAKDMSQRRQLIKREQDQRKLRSVTLSDLQYKIQQGKMQELRVVVKGDVDGSVEAIAQELGGIVHDEVRVSVIHNSVGAISESDVLLAAASQAIIIGFHVQIEPSARELSQTEGVEIRNYKIIYEVVEEIRAALAGLLTPSTEEHVVGTAEVRQTFNSSRTGNIAGCMVNNGQIIRANNVRVLRDGEKIFAGGLSSLRRFKDDVREVNEGFECGIGLEGFNEIQEGDIIESIEIVETLRSL